MLTVITEDFYHPIYLCQERKSKMNLLAYSTKAYDMPFLARAAEGKHNIQFTEKRLTLETASLASESNAIALFTSDDASAPVLRKLAGYGVKYIALRSAGFDHVDLRTAAELGIRVANVPEYSPFSIAEHAVAMLMAVNRKIVQSQLLLQLQDFRLDTLTGFDVHGKVAGVIGTGKIGMAFAKIMTGFGAVVLASDPVRNPDADALGITYVPFDELVKKSDIISIHCPLNDSTRNLFSRDQFGQMKTGAVLINTSRGGILNTADLIDALDNGFLGAACLDVYDKEKGLFFEDHTNSVLTDPAFARLRAFKNVLITGHQAFLTHEALSGIAATTIHNVDCWERSTISPNELNHPETSDQRSFQKSTVRI
jgi:D-lactate dehydrogenase